MGELINLLNRLLARTAQAKIKTALFSSTIHKAVYEGYLEASADVIQNRVIGGGSIKGDGRKLPSPEDDVIGPLVPIMKFYHIFSTFGHVLNIIVASALIYYNRSRVSEENSGQLPALLCHMPRFLIHPVLGSEYMSWLGCTLSSMILMWRVLIIIYQRRLKLDALTYLMIDDKVVEAQSQPYQALRSCINHQQLDLAQRLIFYKVEADRFNYFAVCVRPNRTPEARKHLLKLVHGIFPICNIFFLVLMISFVPMIIWTAFYRFDRFYLGCEPTDSWWDEGNKISTSIALSIVMIFDSFGTELYAIFLDILLIRDLKIYWNKIELELLALNQMMRDQRQPAVSGSLAPEVDDDKPKYVLGRRRLSLAATDSFVASQKKSKKQPLTVELCNIGSLNYLTDCNGTSRLKERIYVFQLVMCDFFVSLAEVDDFISLAIGMTFLIWLATNCAISYIGLQIETSAATLLIRVFQFFMLLIYCMFSAFILDLKQAIDLAYKTLSSITAHDPSPEKRRWLRLLDFYTGKLRHSFTIFHSSTFTSLIFLQSISYTITFSIYMYSIRV